MWRPVVLKDSVSLAEAGERWSCPCSGFLPPGVNGMCFSQTEFLGHPKQQSKKMSEWRKVRDEVSDEYMARCCTGINAWGHALKSVLKWSGHVPERGDMVGTDNSAAPLAEAIHGCGSVVCQDLLEKPSPNSGSWGGAEPVFVSKLSLPAPLSPSREHPDPWRSPPLLPGTWCTWLCGSLLSVWLRPGGDRVIVVHTTSLFFSFSVFFTPLLWGVLHMLWARVPGLMRSGFNTLVHWISRVTRVSQILKLFRKLKMQIRHLVKNLQLVQ